MQLLHHRFKVFPITQPLFPIENRVCFQAEANQRKQALETIGKRMNQSNEEKRGLENDYQCLLERENVLKSALKTAEERCVYVDRFQELLSRYAATIAQ